MKLKPANLQNVSEARDRMQAGEVFYYNGVEFYHYDNGTLGGIFYRQLGHIARPIYRDDCAEVREWKVKDK